MRHRQKRGGPFVKRCPEVAAERYDLRLDGDWPWASLKSREK